MNLKEQWEKAKQNLLESAGSLVYEAWLGKLHVVNIETDQITLGAPDEFSKDWISKHYLRLIEESLEKIGLRPIRVELVVGPGDNKPPDAQIPSPKKEALVGEKTTPALSLNPRFTFENFVVGSSNRFAHAASLAVSDSPAKAYNPLFIYGGVGLGKTHLMQAICHAILQKRSGQFRICYTPSERFTNELIDAIQHRSMARFRAKYRNTDLLVIDDVHFIGGKEATQEEFFNTFNVLYDAHKQIVISSDRTPRDIPNLEERLVSRFGWGLVTDVQLPDYETRVAILKKKIEHEPVAVPDAVVSYIAQVVNTNIRELEGALIRIVAYSLLGNKPITLELAQGALKDLLKETPGMITVDFIQKKVSGFFNLTPQDLKTEKRNKHIVLARQIAMYLARELTNFSLPEIGGFFGGKDHTTVLHSYNKIKKGVVGNNEIGGLVEKITKIIKQ